jgi:hypothetical protein
VIPSRGLQSPDLFPPSGNFLSTVKFLGALARNGASLPMSRLFAICRTPVSTGLPCERATPLTRESLGMGDQIGRPESRKGKKVWQRFDFQTGPEPPASATNKGLRMPVVVDKDPVRTGFSSAQAAT